MKTIQVQLTVTLDEVAAKSLAELLAPAIKQAIGLPPTNSIKRKTPAASISNALFGGENPTEDQGLLIDSRQAAKFLKVSVRTLERLHTSGGMPQPIRIGKAVRWSHEVLKR